MPAKPQTSAEPEEPKRPSTLQFKKVLVPVDFSKCSLAAVRFAVDFARLHGSQLILLHVVEPLTYPPVTGTTNFSVIPMATTREAAKLRLARWRETEIPPDLKADTKLRVGPAYNEISEAARELGVDLIIIPTHGYTGMKHILLGSTAERVVRHAPCPVLTVRQQKDASTQG